MPAERRVTWSHPDIEGEVTAHIDLVSPNKPVYFTNDEPSIGITISNDTEYEMDNSSAVAVFIAIGEGRPEPFIRDFTPNVSLNPGETRTIEVSGEPLSLEGHGIVGIGDGSFYQVNQRKQFFRFNAGKTGSERYEPLLTFSVWDKEHYEVVHGQPQKTQEYALFTSVVLVLLALLQVGNALQLPRLGVAMSAAVLILYWHSGHLTEMIDAVR